MQKKSCATCRHYAAPQSHAHSGGHRCKRHEQVFRIFDPIQGRRVEISELQSCRIERSPGLISSVIYGLAELRKPYCGKHALWHDPL